MVYPYIKVYLGSLASLMLFYVARYAIEGLYSAYG
jgi:hypothetical protein